MWKYPAHATRTRKGTPWRLRGSARELRTARNESLSNFPRNGQASFLPSLLLLLRPSSSPPASSQVVALVGQASPASSKRPSSRGPFLRVVDWVAYAGRSPLQSKQLLGGIRRKVTRFTAKILVGFSDWFVPLLVTITQHIGSSKLWVCGLVPSACPAIANTEDNVPIACRTPS